VGIADLHIHSTYSFDGTASVQKVLEASAKARLDVIVITDHDEICGGLEARQFAEEYGLQAIPGAEVSTREGHLAALYIEEQVPTGLSLVETLLEIGEQGGIGVAAHPDHPVPNNLPIRAILKALEHPLAWRYLRGIEVGNMNPTHIFFNKRSERATASLPLARIASSEAHLAEMVGAGVTHFDGHTPDDLRRAIERRATLPEQVNQEVPLLVFLRWAKLYHQREKSQRESMKGMEAFPGQVTSAR
jgi:predicted metal-dependent phosphoesterase TrpH